MLYLIYFELFESPLETEEIIHSLAFTNTQWLVHSWHFLFFDEPFSFIVDLCNLLFVQFRYRTRFSTNFIRKNVKRDKLL